MNHEMRFIHDIRLITLATEVIIGGEIILCVLYLIFSVQHKETNKRDFEVKIKFLKSIKSALERNPLLTEEKVLLRHPISTSTKGEKLIPYTTLIMEILHFPYFFNLLPPDVIIYRHIRIGAVQATKNFITNCKI